MDQSFRSGWSFGGMGMMFSMISISLKIMERLGFCAHLSAEYAGPRQNPVSRYRVRIPAEQGHTARALSANVLRLVAILGAPLSGLFLSLGALQPAHAQDASLVADAGGIGAAYRIGDCATDLGWLNQIGGWQTQWPNQWSAANKAAPEVKRTALERWRGAPAALDEAVAALREGAQRGRAAPEPIVRRVAQQVSALIENIDNADPAFLSEGESELDRAWNTFVSGALRDALASYLGFLQSEYMDAAPVSPSYATATGSAECFANAVTFWTTLSYSNETIKEIGWRTLREKGEALEALSADGHNTDQILADLRNTAGPETVTREDIETISARAIERARAVADDWFLDGFSTPVTVEPVPSHLEASVPAGFYRPAGEEPAAYVINTSRPQDRRLMAEVITFHETIPGHHLQFSYPTSGEGGSFNSGFGEGWAIYAEHVADEMGVYSTDFDRQGMLAKHLWSATRLVLEPGLHSENWTRAQAIDFMRQHTALSLTEIEVEVDRYIAMPGQSLSYTLGYDYFRQQRDKAEAELGGRFDIRSFHHVVLEGGMRPLPQVGSDIDAWIVSERD